MQAAVAVEAEPELEGVKFGSRYGVIFSHYDLSCALERHGLAGMPGYTREDAARIGINMVLYSLARMSRRRAVESGRIGFPSSC